MDPEKPPPTNEDRETVDAQPPRVDPDRKEQDPNKPVDGVEAESAPDSPEAESLPTPSRGTSPASYVNRLHVGPPPIRRPHEDNAGDRLAVGAHADRRAVASEPAAWLPGDRSELA